MRIVLSNFAWFLGGKAHSFFLPSFHFKMF